MYLHQLLACIDVLLRHCDLDCRSVSLQLLQVLITVQSLSADPQLSDKVRKLAAITIFFHRCGKTGTLLLQFLPLISTF